jgi:hypothetical protein
MQKIVNVSLLEFLNGEDQRHFECANRAVDIRDGKLFCNCCGLYVCEEGVSCSE